MVKKSPMGASLIRIKYESLIEENDFEDVIRNTVSFGGDADTLACIAGSIAEAFYGVSDDLKQECRKRLPEEWSSVIDRFLSLRLRRDSFHDPFPGQK